MILTIEQETSSLAETPEGAADLVTNTRSISTSVYVEDGQILVLGGMTDDELRESEQRVPGIGRVPGLGWLFRNRSTNRVRRNLYVFIRPTILRDGTDAGAVTGRSYRSVRETQMLQAEDPIPLMRNEVRPILPEIEAE